MTRYKMVVLSKPVEGQESRYNDWYDNVHLKQVLSLPGFISAERFKLSVSLASLHVYPYMSVYEIETADPELAAKTLQEAAENGRIEASVAFDYETVFASIYEPFGGVVSSISMNN